MPITFKNVYETFIKYVNNYKIAYLKVYLRLRSYTRAFIHRMGQPSIVGLAISMDTPQLFAVDNFCVACF